MILRQDQPVTEQGWMREAGGPEAVRGEEAQPTRRREPSRAERQTSLTVASGSFAEAVCGLAGLVLTTIGLAAVLPGFMATIATIVLGVGLTARGGSLAGRMRQLREELDAGTLGYASVGSGAGLQVLAGLAGIVLGAIALVGIIPAILVPVSIIAFGGALWLSSVSHARLGMLGLTSRDEHLEFAAREAMVSFAGLDVYLGIAAVILGILALTGLNVLVLSLIGLTAVAAATMAGGSVLGARMVSILR
ncbi:MAG: hypothetical protein ACLFV3_06300 [Phycisphaeraceae bacterium]